ncbi:MAG: Fe-Mn family superoxide dismutase, partial [Candidatus Omnitrophota bacterium]
EHDKGNIVAAKPILVMDVFEHAYMTDYRLDRAKYIEAFFKNIDWKTVQDRF